MFTVANTIIEKSAKQGVGDNMALVEEGKGKERMEKIHEVLAKAKHARIKRESEIDNLVNSEAILEESQRYYTNIYGDKIIYPPAEIEKSDAYLEVTSSFE